MCVHLRAWVLGARRAWGLGNSPEAEILLRTCALLSPCNTNLLIKPTLGFQSIVQGFFCCCCLVIFWLFPSIWGMGWVRHLSFPQGLLGPHPLPAAYVYNVQSVPPFPQKREPPASENGGRWRKREREHPLSKARIQIKKNIIIIII